MKRRLAAILVADVVGYTRLMREDEVGAHTALRAHREAFIAPTIAEHAGRIVKLTGDGALVEFASAVDAVACAAELQRGMAERNGDVPEKRRMVFRMGINLGDVIIEDEDLYGDGVNVAARLEGLAEPGGICLSAKVFDEVRNKLDLTFEDLGDQHVKNVVEPVRVYRIAVDESVGAPASPTGESPRRHQRPSIAVLPLDNLSGDPDQETFAAGLMEDLIAMLSKVPELLVIARNSTQVYKDKTVDVRQVARELGVSHLLEGSIQKSGERLRVTAQLIDGTDGTHLWSGRYDRKVEGLFQLQDEIVKQVLIELQVKLTLGDHARVTSRGTDNLEAWLLEAQAFDEGFKSTREGNIRARDLYEAAKRADPGWSRPLAGIAWTYCQAVQHCWSKSREADIRSGIQLAQKAIEMDAGDPFGYMMLGSLHIESGHFEEGIALREKAVEIAPNDLPALAGLAYKLTLVGQEKRALELFGRAKKLSPLQPWWVLGGEAVARQLLGQHDQAISLLKQSLEQYDRPEVRGHLAAVYADCGRMQEAHAEVACILKQNPNTRVEDFAHLLRFQDSKRNDWYVGLLKAAGFPE